MIPPAKRGGRRQRGLLRALVRLSMAALPTDLPPESRANLYVMLLDWDGGTRKRESHQAAPTAAIIDSQSAKAAQERGSTLHSHGFDAGQKITGPHKARPHQHTWPSLESRRPFG